MTDQQHCRDCGAPLGPPVGVNPVGRPIRECAAGHRQAGPFVEQRAMVGEQE